jgi:hypothetical protein
VNTVIIELTTPVPRRRGWTRDTWVPVPAGWRQSEAGEEVLVPGQEGWVVSWSFCSLPGHYLGGVRRRVRVAVRELCAREG